MISSGKPSPGLLHYETDAAEVYSSEFDVNFTIRSKVFDGNYVAKAYTRDLKIDSNGWITFVVQFKDGHIRQVKQPYHWMDEYNKVLYAFKRNKHWASNSFGLSHELFSLEWNAAVILHFIDNKPFIFTASRGEWEADTTIGQQGEELQIFMDAGNHRRLPISMIPSGGSIWLNHCLEK